MNPEFLRAMHEWNGAIDFGENFVGIQLIGYHRTVRKMDETPEQLLARACAGAMALLEEEIEEAKKHV